MDSEPVERDGGVLKRSLDKDLKKIETLETATRSLGQSLFAPGLALVFLALSGALAAFHIGAGSNALILVVAAVLAGYMALNIGANDVANNVGPAVGARALTMTGALIIAAIFECMGALIAGGDVVQTISKGIIDPGRIADPSTFIGAMMAALVASAVWVNLATWLGAPVSTTHAVVGGVVGAGIAAVGPGAVHWPVIGAIAASWMISPVLGAVIAAGFLGLIKHYIVYREHKIAAARRWVPLLIALMISSFTVYLILKGLRNVWRPSLPFITAIGLATLAGSLVVLRPLIRRQSAGLENRNQSLRKLFRLPLIFSAALLSFAHGANDVSNAVGPLAGILHAAGNGDIDGPMALPFWIMLIGAFGITLGLFLFGPKLIRTVGEQITRMNPMRAFCVALSAAITVIVASALGLPVSSTHIAVGGVFGVGFFREYYTRHSRRRRAYLAHKGIKEPRRMAEETGPADVQDIIRRKLVRRSHFTAIIAAWVITVPAAAALAALVYYILLLATL
jgi:PiT family inorganic phosphate transporter